MKIYNRIKVNAETHRKLVFLGHWLCYFTVVVGFLAGILYYKSLLIFLTLLPIALYIVVNYHLIRGVIYSDDETDT